MPSTRLDYRVSRCTVWRRRNGLYFFSSNRPCVLLRFLVVIYRDGGLPSARASVHSNVILMRLPFLAMSGSAFLWVGCGCGGLGLGAYLVILVTVPAPTVRPPSRMANRKPSSMAIGEPNTTDITVLSPGITISVPEGNDTRPVTSVVLK